MKNGMTLMEDIVMNLTGCPREIANTVVNAILTEDMSQNSTPNEIREKFGFPPIKES